MAFKEDFMGFNTDSGRKVYILFLFWKCSSVRKMSKFVGLVAFITNRQRDIFSWYFYRGLVN